MEEDFDLDWAEVLQDPDRLEEVEIERDGKRFAERTRTQGVRGKVFQAVGVALPRDCPNYHFAVR